MKIKELVLKTFYPEKWEEIQDDRARQTAIYFLDNFTGGTICCDERTMRMMNEEHNKRIMAGQP